MSDEVQDRLQREREAAAFLSSLGPKFEKVRPVSPVGLKKSSVGVNGLGSAVNGSSPVLPTESSTAGQGGAISSVVTVSREAEEKRQEALRRLKATHCSVNHEKVSDCYLISCSVSHAK